MRVIITGRHYSVSTGLKAVIEEKLDRVRYFYDHILNFHVIVEKKKAGFKAEIDFSADGKHFYVQEQAATLNEAIDLLIDKLERQIRKHKNRIQEKKKRGRRLVIDQAEAVSSEQLSFVKISDAPRAELDVILELALSPSDMTAYYTDEEPKRLILLVKEDNDCFRMIGRDTAKDRWLLKRVYMDGEVVERTSMEDYAPLTSTVHEAMTEVDKLDGSAFVFYNKNDHQLQAINSPEPGTYELLSLADQA